MSEHTAPPTARDHPAELTWAERHLDLLVVWPMLPARDLRAIAMTTFGALLAGSLVWVAR